MAASRAISAVAEILVIIASVCFSFIINYNYLASVNSNVNVIFALILCFLVGSLYHNVYVHIGVTKAISVSSK